MNTFSENGNDFVGRLLHEGEMRPRGWNAVLIVFVVGWRGRVERRVSGTLSIVLLHV